jgi:hypothetical protein
MKLLGELLFLKNLHSIHLLTFATFVEHEEDGQRSCQGDLGGKLAGQLSSTNRS